MMSVCARASRAAVRARPPLRVRGPACVDRSGWSTTPFRQRREPMRWPIDASRSRSFSSTPPQDPTQQYQDQDQDQYQPDEQGTYESAYEHEVVETPEPKQPQSQPQPPQNFVQQIRQAAQDKDIFAVRDCVRREFEERQSLMEQQKLPDFGPGDEVNTASFHLALGVCTANFHPQSAQIAEEILELMWRGFHAKTMPRAFPSNATYLHLIKCWETLRDQNKFASNRIIRVLKELRDKYMKYNRKDTLMPTADHYRVVARLCANQGEPLLATEVYRMFKDDYARELTNDSPNASFMSYVMSAWRNSNRPESPERVQQLLEEMRTEAQAGNLALQPSPETYSNVIKGWMSSNHPEAPRRSEEFLDEMIRWQAEGDSEARPEVQDYTMVMNAYAERGDTTGTERILRRCLDDFQAGLVSEGPNVFSFGIFLKSLSLSNMEGAPEMAESIIQEMWEHAGSEVLRCKPDVVTYNTAIMCWARSRRPEAGERAEALLTELFHRFHSGDQSMKPNLETFNSVCNAWSHTFRSDAFSRIMFIISEMNRMGYVPNEWSFNAALRAIAKSNMRGKPHHAEQVMKMIRAQGIKFDPHTSKLYDQCTSVVVKRNYPREYPD